MVCPTDLQAVALRRLRGFAARSAKHRRAVQSDDQVALPVTGYQSLLSQERPGGVVPGLTASIVAETTKSVTLRPGAQSSMKAFDSSLG